MLRRFLIGLLLTILSLLVIDRTSLLVAPCTEYSAQKHDGTNKYECATREGIIVAGIEWLADLPPETWTALATIFIAIFTGTLWFATNELRKAGDRQDELTKILERAYLSVEPLGINRYVSQPEGPPSNKIVGHINILNVGRLPAKVWISENQPLIKWDERSDLKEEDLQCGEGVDEVGVLGPGGKMPVGTGFIPDDDMGKTGYFYIWGRVDYLDGFETKKRTTKFCHRYPSLPYELDAEGGKTIDAKHARYHQHGNNAD
jgi:hypothetical protein